MRSRLTLPRAAAGAALLGLLGVLVVLLLSQRDPAPTPEEEPGIVSVSSPFQNGDSISRPKNVRALSRASANDRHDLEPEPEEEPAQDADRWKSADIEEIKHAIYEREIDSVDKLDLLEEFVQIGDADTRDFWNTDWAGVDDWKRYSDGFSLEELDDGTLVFVPDEETMRQYSFSESMSVYEYDDVSQEFVHEVDYFGKPIRNVVKFLRNDVMVRMTVSGKKVDLNIYELDPKSRD